MTHWLLEELNDTREQAIEQADRALIFRELLNESSELDVELLSRSAEALEMVVLDLVFEDITDDEEKQKELKGTAADAFRLLRALPRPTDPLDAGKFLLRAGTLAVLGDRGFDAARWLKRNPGPTFPWIRKIGASAPGQRFWTSGYDLFVRMGGLTVMLYWSESPVCVMPNLILKRIILKDWNPPMRKRPHSS